MCWYGIRFGKIVCKNDEGSRAADTDKALGDDEEAEFKNEKKEDDGGVIFEGDEGNGARMKDSSPAKSAANRT